MALMHCHLYSNALGMASSIDIIMPQFARDADPRPVDLLWLLHGLSDDHTIWQRRTAIERYAEAYDLAIIMPNVHRSFYTDMKHGYKYWTYLSEELPALVQQFIKLPAAGSREFVAGLSMGGYGAFKLALRQPERFTAAASLSGALDMPYRTQASVDDRAFDFNLVFGGVDAIAGSENDLKHLLSTRVAEGSALPRLFQWCGREDFLYDRNVAFRDHARALKVDLHYEESAGDHSWRYWDMWIERVLQWMLK